MRFLQNQRIFPLLLLVIAVCMSLALWALPAWMRFESLSLLWETDRRAFVLLLIQLVSPLLVILFGCVLWQLVALLLPYMQELLPLVIPPNEKTPVSRPTFPSPTLPKIRKISPPLSSAAPEPSPEVERIAQREEILALPREALSALQRQRRGSLAQEARPSRTSAHVTTLRARRQARFSGEGTRASGLRVVLSPQPLRESEGQEPSEPASLAPSLHVSEHRAADRPASSQPLVLRVLGKASLTLSVGDIQREVYLVPNAKRTQLLAYLACAFDREVQRDRMVEQVFGHGDEDATARSLSEAFESHKKLLRLDLRRSIELFNGELGYEAIPLDVSLFTHRLRIYTISPACRVADLPVIEREGKALSQAHRTGQLAEGVPLAIKEGCDRLLDVYQGDFLEELVTNYLADLDPWTESWIREPYTHYRDYALSALWCRAEYYLQEAQKAQPTPTTGSQEVLPKRVCAERAAADFRAYAEKACGSRFDLKVSFKRPSERVVMAERACRRTLAVYGLLSATEKVDEFYASFCRSMRTLSANNWTPSADTLSDLEAAKAQTREYRFSDERLKRPTTLAQEGAAASRQVLASSPQASA